MNKRFFEAVMQSKDLKIGAALTQREFDAIEFLLGDLFKLARALKPQILGEIKFTESGSAYTTDGNRNEISINGKIPFNISDNLK